jgi:predicted NBD/HSP70 family sugar kinase
VLDPQSVVVGGPWASHPTLIDRLPDAVADLAAVATEVRFATLGPDAPHLGARRAAVAAAQAALTGRLSSAARP